MSDKNKNKRFENDHSFQNKKSNNKPSHKSGKPETSQPLKSKSSGNRQDKTYSEGSKNKFSPKEHKPTSPSFSKKREEKGKASGFDKKGKTAFTKPKDKKNNPVTPDYNFFQKAPSRKKQPDTSTQDNRIRLNKYIANAGVCSRRDADLLIQAGEIKVNGEIITELGYKVNPGDIVKYGKKVLSRQKNVYVLLNKPKDFITTMDDPDNRKTVMNLVENACDERIYPVGRLDRNTTGLILLTNDGELAEKLAHPSNKIKKIYQVDLNKPITQEDFEKIQNGLQLEDGEAKVDDIAIISADKTILGVEIHIGRNRIVRRIFEHLGYEVVRLDRVMYAGLTKKDLSRGHWRYLTEKEVIKLKFLT
jgi:23S rRNA pseudouridine2605 synthase